MTEKDILHMAELSRLQISSEETLRFKEQFAAILDYMSVLQDVDVTGVEPLYSPSQHQVSARVDEPCERFNHDAILANAPETDGTYFVVPRIV